MKLAVIGSGPLAIEASLHFYTLGADVKIFRASDSWGGSLARAKNQLSLLDYNWDKLVSENGRSFVESSKIPDGEAYLDYLTKIGEKFEGLGIVKKARVKRVHKRFLNPHQVPNSSSRLADLFRVVFAIDTSKSTDELKEENLEMFEKLGEEVISSLKDDVESFEDFDLVIDAKGETNFALPMGASQTYALNEKVVGVNENIFYGKDILSSLSKLEEAKRVTIIGDGEFSLFALNFLKESFSKNKNRELNIITQSKIPFEGISSPVSKSMLKGFQEFLSSLEAEFNEDINIFEKKIIQWKELDAHIKAKTPRPAEPRRRFMIYNGAIVSSVDKLLDREGLFTTIEGHSLIGTNEQLKVIGSDLIIVDKGFKEDLEFSEGLNKEDEPGYFKLSSNDIFDGLSDIENIEKEVMRYFSKA